MTGNDSENGSDLSAVDQGDVHVLLVDDDESWVTSTAQVLGRQRDAFTVETATDLETAAAAFAESDPDCVVCDYMLESGTGLDFLADVRAVDDRPFILITGQGSESVASEAIGRQVTDYLPKRSLGGRGDRLARRIETAVESYRTEQALARERRSKEAMLDILTATSSREGLAREFCEHLVTERGYACAWVGSLDRSGGVVPRAAAGDEAYLDAAIEPGTTPATGAEPAFVALDRREPHVVAPIEAGATADDWRRVAGERGFESAAAVPIDHEGTVRGVLAVYGTDPGIDPDERDLLAEYGETIGYALRTAEWKESLLSAAPTAVEIELTGASVPLIAVDRQLPDGSRLDVLTTVPREGTLLYVLRVAGATPADVRDGATAVERVERVEVTRSGDSLRCELVVAVPTPETVIVDHGGRIADETVERGRASITAVRPSDGDVRSLIDAVRSVYPDAGVRSVRSTDAAGTATSPDDAFRSLTDKQRRALELAFYNGYFERPREHNTTEIAEKLGVSRQTLTQHLRAAERKLLAGFFEPADGRSD